MIRAADVMHDLVLDQVTDRDRQWFEEHPSSRWYTRPAVPHEVCLPGMRCVDVAGSLMKVHLIAPGLRMRVMVSR